jgi:hypothetical protein
MEKTLYSVTVLFCDGSIPLSRRGRDRNVVGFTVTCDTGFVELSSISAIIRMRTSPVIYKNCRNGGRDGSTLTATQKVLRVG